MAEEKSDSENYPGLYSGHGSRYNSRKRAMQVIYESEIKKENLRDILENKVADLPKNLELTKFSTELVKGVSENLGEIDKKITEHLYNWKFDRIDLITLAILRLSVYEIAFAHEERKIVFQQAQLLAAEFGPEKSAQFILGILENID